MQYYPVLFFFRPCEILLSSRLKEQFVRSENTINKIKGITATMSMYEKTGDLFSSPTDSWDRLQPNRLRKLMQYQFISLDGVVPVWHLSCRLTRGEVVSNFELCPSWGAASFEMLCHGEQLRQHSTKRFLVLIQHQLDPSQVIISQYLLYSGFFSFYNRNSLDSKILVCK